jgi:DNA-binding NarL/FixJ family response regulator
VKAAQELRPDVVVMDLSIPGINGVAATHDIGTVHVHVARADA